MQIERGNNKNKQNPTKLCGILFSPLKEYRKKNRFSFHILRTMEKMMNIFIISCPIWI